MQRSLAMFTHRDVTPSGLTQNCAKWLQCLIVGAAVALPAAMGIGSVSGAAASPAASGPVTIYIVRHGETDWNKQNRIQGNTDNPLNATGQRQAAAVAAQLAGVRFDRIYPSALTRAIQTAEVFAVRAPIQPLALLNERSRGIYEGKVTSEVAKEFSPRFAALDDDMDGGESLASIAVRVGLATREIVAQNPGGTVMIVGHSGVNPLVIGELIGLSPQRAIKEIRQGNDEVYKVTVQPHGGPVSIWKLIPENRLNEL